MTPKQAERATPSDSISKVKKTQCHKASAPHKPLPGMRIFICQDR